MKNYITELLGTFFLVFSVYLTVSQGLALAPLTIGSTLMIMVYMGGSVSGAHYNPAVTISLAVLGKLSFSEALMYIIAQLSGAILASIIAGSIIGFGFYPAPAESATSFSALLVEVLFTFALVLVVLNVAVSDRNSGNSYFGLAIGMTVFIAATAGGGISGGAYNPAVGLGPAIVSMITDASSLSHVWLYIIGPILGGLLAVGVFKIQESN